MSTAVKDIELEDLEDLDLDGWVWDDQDMTAWLSFEETAVLLHLPWSEIAARHELLTGKDSN